MKVLQKTSCQWTTNHSLALHVEHWCHLAPVESLQSSMLERERGGGGMYHHHTYILVDKQHWTTYTSITKQACIHVHVHQDKLQKPHNHSSLSTCSQCQKFVLQISIRIFLAVWDIRKVNTVDLGDLQPHSTHKSLGTRVVYSMQNSTSK